MKRTLLIAAAALLCVAAAGQEKISKANYALAERFSAKKVNQLRASAFEMYMGGLLWEMRCFDYSTGWGFRQ